MIARQRLGVAVSVLFGLSLACTEPPGPDPSDGGAEDGAVDGQPPDGEPADAGPDASDGGAPDVHPDTLTEDAFIDAADANLPDSLPDTLTEDGSADVSPDTPVGPAVCGDGIRDPETEECDDGLDGDAGYDRACTSDCMVVDRTMLNDPLSKEHWLGGGHHPVAGGPLGHAVAMVELVDSTAAIVVTTYSPVGAWLGTAVVPNGLLDADPLLAALPNGDYALAYAALDTDGDELGIALTRVPQAGGPVSSMGAANENGAFTQRAPDIVWTGNELVVGWEDDNTIPKRICTRTFDQALQPTQPDDCGLPGIQQSLLALAPTSLGVAKAWREEAATGATVVVTWNASAWESPSIGLPPGDERPALAELEPGRVLVVYGDEAGVEHAVVLDGNASAVAGPVDLNNAAIPRSTPSLAVTEDGIYLAWREPAADPDPDAGWNPDYEELWLQRLGWDGAVLDVWQEAIPLPRLPGYQTGDQSRPALAAVPYSQGGALLAAWNDDNTGAGQHGGVTVELVPTPVLRKGLAY